MRQVLGDAIPIECVDTGGNCDGYQQHPTTALERAWKRINAARQIVVDSSGPNAAAATAAAAAINPNATLTTFVAIENFIAREFLRTCRRSKVPRLQECALIVTWSPVFGGQLRYSDSGLVLVPPQFVDMDVDYSSLPGQKDWTYGQRIHEAHPEIPADDWSHHFSRSGERIVAAAAVADGNNSSEHKPQMSRIQHLVGLIQKTTTPDHRLRNALRRFDDGVGFDLWSLFVNQDNVMRLMRHMEGLMTWHLDMIANVQLKSIFVAGLGEHGTVLGALLASCARVPFVPLCGGYFPCNDESIGGRRICIVVVGIMDTGIVHECRRLRSRGLTPTLVMAAMDRPESRGQWRRQMANENVCLCIDCS